MILAANPTHELTTPIIEVCRHGYTEGKDERLKLSLFNAIATILAANPAHDLTSEVLEDLTKIIQDSVIDREVRNYATNALSKILSSNPGHPLTDGIVIELLKIEPEDTSMPHEAMIKALGHILQANPGHPNTGEALAAIYSVYWRGNSYTANEAVARIMLTANGDEEWLATEADMLEFVLEQVSENQIKKLEGGELLAEKKALIKGRK